MACAGFFPEKALLLYFQIGGCKAAALPFRIAGEHFENVVTGRKGGVEFSVEESAVAFHLASVFQGVFHGTFVFACDLHAAHPLVIGDCVVSGDYVFRSGAFFVVAACQVGLVELFDRAGERGAAALDPELGLQLAELPKIPGSASARRP
ncbi:MAG: hypothetical protein H6841_02225 [Planctomycetes bacterium]|nr:hypothetical protein [Planctomycetota bacterium]